VARRYRISRDGLRSTEQLVEAGGYGYVHSCVTSDNFPVRAMPGGPRVSEIVLLGFEGDVTTAEALAEAARRRLERPTNEDALRFGAEHPEPQREHPIAFLHDPWVGFFGRRDVLCLWSNAGRRELGLEGFDDRWTAEYRFAFVAPTEVTIRRADLLSPAARVLIEALNAELTSRYPEDGARHFELDADEVASGRGAFLIASRAGEPVGCGAVRRIETGIGEIKRMYVSPAARGLGVGRAVLSALETEARALDCVRLVLETGIRQPEAIALYERAGFSRIAAFGESVSSPLSVCMAKHLGAR